MRIKQHYDGAVNIQKMTAQPEAHLASFTVGRRTLTVKEDFCWDSYKWLYTLFSVPSPISRMAGVYLTILKTNPDTHHTLSVTVITGACLLCYVDMHLCIFCQPSFQTNF